MKTYLNGWKEISQFLGRGERTAQRWERFYGLPVHRPAGQRRQAVVAVTAEVEGWLATCPMFNASNDPEQLEAQLRDLEQRCEQIRSKLRQAGITAAGVLGALQL